MYPSNSYIALPSLIILACYLFSSVHAAISILTPNSSQGWLLNNTVSSTWSAAPNDPAFFTVLLNNTGKSNLLNGQTAQLAQNLTTSMDMFSLLLPGVPVGSDYIILFVNSSLPTQIFAQSQPFSVAAGNVTSTSSTMAGGANGSGMMSSTSAEIPGGTGGGGAFPSTSATSTSSGMTSPTSAKSGAISLKKMCINTVLMTIGLGLMSAGMMGSMW